MKRLVFSLFTSSIAAILMGLGVYLFFWQFVFPDKNSVFLWLPILLWSLSLSFIFNFVFFFIRRWDGCIEKLGGLTFSLFILLSSTTPFLILRVFFERDGQIIIDQFLVITLIQVLVIGFITTCFLRTKNYQPPKTGRPFKW